MVFWQFYDIFNTDFDLESIEIRLNNSFESLSVSNAMTGKSSLTLRVNLMSMRIGIRFDFADRFSIRLWNCAVNVIYPAYCCCLLSCFSLHLAVNLLTATLLKKCSLHRYRRILYACSFFLSVCLTLSFFACAS